MSGRDGFDRDYFNVYRPHDERLPRLRRQPDSHPIHVTELFTREEKKTSAVHNEVLARGQARNGVMVRLDGPNRPRPALPAARRLPVRPGQIPACPIGA